jgi:hypothetical protein
MTAPARDPIERLADDVRAKILAKRDVLAASEGEVTVRIFRRNGSYDIKSAFQNLSWMRCQPMSAQARMRKA